MEEHQKIVIKSLDGVCLIDLRYIDSQGIEDLLHCKPGSIVRVMDVDKAVRFIDYPQALKDVASKVD